MLKRIVFLLLLGANGVAANAGTTYTFPFAGSRVELLDSAGAAAANGASDAYSKALTPFDLQIRLGMVSGASERDYLSRAASQVRNWPAAEQQQLKEAFASIDSFLKINKITLSLPPVIQVIKTEGKEEFGAEGYTRLSHITLCTASGPITPHLVAHELFHVYSRFNPVQRDELYSLFGFKKCNPIDVHAAMGYKAITNPDCPLIEHFITVKTADGKAHDFVLVLYTDKDYAPEYSLGDYMNLGVLEVEGNNSDKRAVMRNGKGLTCPIDQLPDLFRQIGTNTAYIIHPEEITAEHFALWVIGSKVPQPQFFDRMKAVLAKR